jgi:hypothetical protein
MRGKTFSQATDFFSVRRLTMIYITSLILLFASGYAIGSISKMKKRLEEAEARLRTMNLGYEVLTARANNTSDYIQNKFSTDMALAENTGQRLSALESKIRAMEAGKE